MKPFTGRDTIQSTCGFGYLASRYVKSGLWFNQLEYLTPLFKALAARALDFTTPLVGLKLDPALDIALVTGGSGGLGWELVRELRGKGIVTIILDIVPPRDMDCYKDVHFYTCDISIPGRIREIHEQILEEVGDVTILINNAAITSDMPLESVDNEVIEKIVRVNLLGPYMVTREFLPSMLSNNRGYVVNIASILGFVSPARLTAYGASKGGLIALHESLAAELEQYNWRRMGDAAYLPMLKSRGTIRSLLVCPGKIDTKMFDNAQSPSKLIAPDLDPKYLARVIIRAIECSRTGTLRLPYYTNLMTYFKSLDWPWFRLFRLLTGVDAIVPGHESGAYQGCNSA